MVAEMKCERCGREFKSEHGLLTHIGMAHGEGEHLTKEERLRICYLKLKRMLDLKMYTLEEMEYVLMELNSLSEASELERYNPSFKRKV